MEFLYEVGLFASKGFLIFVAVFFGLMATTALFVKRKRPEDEPSGHLLVRHLNEMYKDLKRVVDVEHFDPKTARKAHKSEAKARKAEAKQRQSEAKQKSKEETASDEPPQESGIFVIDFKGDIEASSVEHLRREVTAILVRSKKPKEVVVRVESTGGYVHSYGFAASQLLRIREAGIKLTVAVDQVAASGGYMMAAVADRIIAAPFAVIGSIGVAAELPNIHRLLRKHDIDYEILTAGKHKRTLTVFGENKEEHREKLQSEMDETHSMFQDFVSEYRAETNVEDVATGETWYGARALDLKLIDEIKTSDQYILDACNDDQVYQLQWVIHERPFMKVANKITGSIQWVQSWMRSLGRSV